MGWVNWSRKSDAGTAATGTGTVGLELNAGAARAVGLGPGRPPRPLLLADPHEELPLAVSLERRHPEVGRAALGLVRRLPHLAATGFLPFLGQVREWKAGRHCLDAGALLGLAFEKLRTLLPASEPVAAA